MRGIHDLKPLHLANAPVPATLEGVSMTHEDRRPVVEHVPATPHSGVSMIGRLYGPLAFNVFATSQHEVPMINLDVIGSDELDEIGSSNLFRCCHEPVACPFQP
jgi:hypothetical protein